MFFGFRWLLVFAWMVGLSGWSRSQETELGLGFRSIARAQQSRVRPGGVLIMKATATNTGAEPATGTLVLTIDGVASQRSARRVTVGAESYETVDIYAQLPKSIAGKKSIDVTVTMYVDEGGRQVVLDRGGQPAEHTLTLSVDRMPSLAALVMEPEAPPQPSWHWPLVPPFASYELSVASRIQAGNTRQTANFDTRRMPICASDWDVIDTMIVSESGAMNDAAFVDSLKTFVSKGGRAWFMLDRINDEGLQPLLGHGQTCTTVDEVELNEFTVELIGGTAQFSKADRTVKSDRSLSMKRVLQTGGRVTHEVNGWPAAIWMQLGYGEILITTLDCEAWITANTEHRREILKQSPFKVRVWGNQLALEINAERQPMPLSETTDYVIKHIGNPVVPRSWVAVSLVSFCLVLGALGGWRFLVGDLGLFGILAPLAGAIASAGLLIASSYIRREIPESVPGLQLVHVAEDGSVLFVREQAAVYLEGESSMSLECDVDGRAVVDEQVTAGVRTFETTGFQDWRLSNDAWPPGLWRYQSEFVLPADNFVAQATLNENGVELTLPETPEPLEDFVLGYVLGDPMLCTRESGRLFADGKLNADGNRWITGAIISDEQQRRLEVYREFFNPALRVGRRGGVLYGWTRLWPGGPKWSRDLPRQGSALVAIPVQLATPRPGTELFVPHGLIQLRRNPNELGQTFAFNDETGRWAQELTMKTNARLQFVLPSQIVPFTAKSFEIQLDIRAPKRDVRLVGNASGQTPVEIVRLESPSIPWTGTITDPAILADASDGILDIQLEISDRMDIENQEQQSNVVAWQVDRLHLSVRGAVSSERTGETTAANPGRQ